MTHHAMSGILYSTRTNTEGDDMKIDAYFKKNGKVYGIEGEVIDGLFGKPLKIITFDNIEEALCWEKERTENYRYLSTKTDAHHAKMAGASGIIK